MSTSKREFALQTYLDNKYGPPPHNPFKVMRYEKNFSLQQLSVSTGLSKNSIVKTENGTFNRPSDSIVDFWVRKGYAYNDLLLAYEEFQLSMRERATLYFGPSLAVKTDYGTNHPLRQLRYSRPSPVDGLALPVGIEQVSRDLCLPVDTLRFYEKKYARQKSTPKGLLLVLSSIGYNGKQVTQYDVSYRIWRSNNLTRLVSNDESLSA